MQAGGDEATLRARRDERLAQLDADFAFLAECNVGGEFLAPDKIAGGSVVRRDRRLPYTYSCAV